MKKQEKITIIGAGLSGTLLALRLAQRGYQISLHEKRADMRTEEMMAGRSINLALSNRGLMALDIVGLRERVLKECIPMRGRMVHPLGGEKFLSRYSGREEDYINSVSRGGLNITLLNEADKLSNVKVYFNSNCTHVDLKSATAFFNNTITGEKKEEQATIVVGADGAGSAVRRSMMAKTTDLLFSYSQDFLQTGYKELSIHPAKDGGWKIEKNALHIFPRGRFMIIALPNLDGSFTLTMFQTFGGENGFRALDTREKVKAFFEKYFSDLLPYIPHYLDEFFENPTGALGTIKCSPWQAYEKVVVLGDAAHAVVPFYGQGMNASFEDVRVFDEILEKHDGDWSKILPEFEAARIENGNAIGDLAVENLYEMQDRVDDEDFKKKRKLEMQLEQKYADYYSKYSLVTFRPELSYVAAMKLGRAQDDLLLKICTSSEYEKISLEEVYQRLRSLR